MELTFHSILTSRVVLNIRATHVWSDGLTELNTNHIRDGEIRILNPLESIKFSATKRSSIG